MSPVEALRSALAAPPVPRPERLGLALSAIARTVAESLELPEIFSRVAEAARTVLPFETMGVGVVHDPATPFENLAEARFSAYAVVGTASPEQIGDYRRSDVSPGLRLREVGKVSRYADVGPALDPSFLLDRRLQSLVCRSLMVCLLPAARPLGSIWFASAEPGAFDPEDEAAVLAIADLVAVALQHDRLFRAERERRRRSEALEALVPALSRALDIRKVFDQLSIAVGEILPHDRMVLGLLSEDRTMVRIHAFTGENVHGISEPKPVPPSSPADWTFFLVRDLREDPACCGDKFDLVKREGLRSLLRVPIRLEGEIVGGLTFLSRTVGAYREEDVDIARRIADQVALVLSHEQLAEEARVAIIAREKAVRLEGRIAALTEQLASYAGGPRPILGSSKGWRDVLDFVSKVAPTETTVLLTGESGTGKEVVARAIHAASPRAEKPFLAINCAALPEALLESELFGYERGAFTGAQEARAGKVEQAAEGVLFLDEVAEMSPGVQAKFLRVLQEREFQRLGGTRVRKADVRIIAATNRNLSQALARGQFREDLYYRLGVFEIALPPLRERREDILPLAEAFVEEIRATLNKPCAGISKQAKDLLLSYPWPGNVRELRSAIERAIILCDGGLVTAEHLPTPRVTTERAAGAGLAPLQSLGDVERGLVETALKEARNNKALAARLLGITRSQLYSRLGKYGLR